MKDNDIIAEVWERQNSGGFAIAVKRYSIRAGGWLWEETLYRDTRKEADDLAKSIEAGDDQATSGE
jgi:hypothetical protein